MKMSRMKPIGSENFVELRKLAIEADVPVAPNIEDNYALYYLRRIQINIEELNEIDDMDDRLERVSELAEDSVPISTYGQFNAYSQLGLYQFDDDSGLLESQSEGYTSIESYVMMTLYLFAEEALIQVGLNQ